MDIFVDFVITCTVLCCHGYELWPCVCLSVSVSIYSRYSIESDGWLDLVLAWRLLSTSPTQCYKEIQVSTKVTLLLSETFC